MIDAFIAIVLLRAFIVGWKPTPISPVPEMSMLSSESSTVRAKFPMALTVTVPRQLSNPRDTLASCSKLSNSAFFMNTPSSAIVQCASRVCMHTSITGSFCWDRSTHHRSMRSAKSRGCMVQSSSMVGESDSFVNIEARSTQLLKMLFARCPSETISQFVNVLPAVSTVTTTLASANAFFGVCASRYTSSYVIASEKFQLARTEWAETFVRPLTKNGFPSQSP